MFACSLLPIQEDLGTLPWFIDCPLTLHLAQEKEERSKACLSQTQVEDPLLVDDLELSLEPTQNFGKCP